jgi:hypothetical protein
VLKPGQRFALMVGAGLLAGTLLLFWSLYRAMRDVQAFS